MNTKDGEKEVKKLQLAALENLSKLICCAGTKKKEKKDFYISNSNSIAGEGGTFIATKHIPHQLNPLRSGD